MLKDPRKVFSITQYYDPKFIFPGAALPGPEPTLLTEIKEYEGQTYYPGQIDPEWVKPDDENIPLGTYADRFWYSIRADISTDLADMGNPDPELDPQVHETVPAEIYDEMIRTSGAVAELQMIMGIRHKDDRFRAMFPNANSLETALRDNPEMVQAFLAQEAATDAQIMQQLGVVKAS